MGARELLSDLAEAGITVAADGDRLVVRPASKLNADARAALQAAKPQLLAFLRANLTQRPYKLPPAEAGRCHAEPWNDTACAVFVARITRFMRLGISAADADDLAERLHLRDVEGDDRRHCVECRHLAREAPSRWECREPSAAGFGSGLSSELVTMSQRCPAFTSAEATAPKGPENGDRSLGANEPC